MSVAAAAAAGGATGGPAAVSLNDALFWSRCSALLDSWKAGGKAWHGQSGSAPVDCLLLLTGSGDSDEAYSRLIASQLWLFGYEIPESAILFSATDGITVLTSSKKCKILQPLAASQHRPPHIALQLLEHNKGDRNEANFSQLLSAIQQSGKGKRVGVLPNKSAESALSAALLPRVSEMEGGELVDVSSAWGLLLSVHDAAARQCLEKAAELSTRVMKKYLVSEMETIIDEAKQHSQQQLADSTEDAIRNPTKIGITALGPKEGEVKLSADDVDSCYTPIIQSGGVGEGSDYDLKVSAASPALPLQYDSETSIIVQLGARYRNLCSNIGRTYFINPSQQQKDTYLLLTQIYLQCKQAIRPGNKLSAVMLNAKRVIQQSKQAGLEEKFTKNCGFGIGFEFRDPSLLLTDKNQRVMQAGMAFNLAIGFTDLTTASGKKYAVFLADTILVKATDCESLTKMPREYKDVTYLLGGDADGADGADGEGAAAGVGGEEGDEYASGARATRGSAARAESEVSKNSAEAKAMAAHQAELARKQREIALRKLAAAEAEGQFNSGLDDKQGQVQAYASPSAFPPQARKDRIHVDHVAEALLLPIYDQLVPFHINTVKNVHRQEEGAQGATSLRITFFTPDAKLTQAQQSLGIGNPAAPTSSAANGAPHSAASVQALRYISELTYRSNTGSLDKVFYDIKELRKRVQNRMKELEAKQSLVVQADLVLDRRGPVPTLKDVQARPQLSRKKTTGALTAHVNGLRYLTSDKFKVDVLYSNIKAAFYQPAEDTHQVLLHFELQHPILLDKSKTKKTSFLQVYFEVVDVSEDINSTNRYRDEDGLMEEQQERQRRRKWNERFLTFVKEVEKKLSASQSGSEPQQRIEFDIPYRELKFTGVPAKSSVDIMPTVHSLVALDDQPPLVLPLNEVEIAVFERVQFGLRNFDLVFVYKDFQRLPMRIDSIPMKYLEPIKHWLNSCDLVYYESNQNLLWKAVMKHINSDVEDFWTQGGWSFLADQDDAETGEGGEDGDEGGGGEGRGPVEESESEFEVSSAEDEDDDSEEYETASSEEEDEDEEEEDSAADDSEDEGEDWDELENKAKKDDRSRREKAREKGERDFSDEDDDDGAARGRETQGAKKKQKPPPPPPARPAQRPAQQPANRPKPAVKPVAKPAAKPAAAAARR